MREGSGIAIIVQCERQVAFDSPDHIMPEGTRQDNSSNMEFLGLLTRLYPGRSINLLDIGCSGGKFVKDCLDLGHVAVGLEGSDFSKNRKRAEWRTIPENLFTCDVTRKFQVLEDGKPMKFDIITSWELIEHINEGSLPGLCANARGHLKDGGLWIMSIANVSAMVNGVELHQSQKPKSWWVEFFKKQGFHTMPEFIEYFQPDWVRGSRETSSSFHLVLTNNAGNVPVPPRRGLAGRLFRKFLCLWAGSKPQRIIWRLAATGAN